MKRTSIGTLAWLAILAVAPAAAGQALPDEITGVLEVGAHEAVIVADGRIRLVHVSPQTGVDLDALFDEMADQVRFLNGQEVTATGELEGDVLWSAQVKPAVEDVATSPVEGPGPELAELTGVVQVGGGAASIDGVRLIRVPPQTGVSLGPLLARAAADFAGLAGQKVLATGELDGDVLWSAMLEPVEEEEVPDEAPEEVQEELEEEVQEESPEGIEEELQEEAEPVDPTL